MTVEMTLTGTYQWACVPMGFLTASQEMQRFAEGVLQPFSSSTTFEYTDVLGTTKRAHVTEAVYIDDTCVVSFGTRAEHEILLLRVLKRLDVHNLKMHPAKCDFLHHESLGDDDNRLLNSISARYYNRQIRMVRCVQSVSILGS
jgi:hypothetical protein